MFSSKGRQYKLQTIWVHHGLHVIQSETIFPFWMNFTYKCKAPWWQQIITLVMRTWLGFLEDMFIWKNIPSCTVHWRHHYNMGWRSRSTCNLCETATTTHIASVLPMWWILCPWHFWTWNWRTTMLRLSPNTISNLQALTPTYTLEVAIIQNEKITFQL